MKIIECVPNFSEGCDQKKIAAIAKVFESHSFVKLIDFSGDADHNRSVFTFLGEPADILEAALAACGKALELIDMSKQAGVHPRLGAVDVVPFIPLAKAKMKDAVDLAHTFGRQLYERFGVPVYFYGHAAMVPWRNELADVRRGGYEALARKMTRTEDAPDVGKPEFNVRAGATAVGAREPLVAYNINLDCADLRLVQKIASQIREKGGGLKHVRAIGVILKSRGIAQVSINLTNCKEMPLKSIYDEVKTLTAQRGVEILESELIGLVPKCAFAGTTPKYLKLKDFDKQRLLETHLKDFSHMSLANWLAKKGNVGGTARAVANGWKKIKEENPKMRSRDIAEAYINFRYTITGEPHLAEKVHRKLPYDVDPLILSWTILMVENEDEISTVLDHKEQWKQIMREEIKKCGIEPE